MWGSESNGFGGSVPLFRKFLQPSSGTGTTSKDLMLKYQVLPLLRLAEMYLIAMETAPSESEANRLYKDFMLSRQMLVSRDLSLAALRQVSSGTVRGGTDVFLLQETFGLEYVMG